MPNKYEKHRSTKKYPHRSSRERSSSIHKKKIRKSSPNHHRKSYRGSSRSSENDSFRDRNTSRSYSSSSSKGGRPNRGYRNSYSRSSRRPRSRDRSYRNRPINQESSRVKKYKQDQFISLEADEFIAEARQAVGLPEIHKSNNLIKCEFSQNEIPKSFIKSPLSYSAPSPTSSFDNSITRIPLHGNEQEIQNKKEKQKNQTNCNSNAAYVPGFDLFDNINPNICSDGFSLNQTQGSKDNNSVFKDKGLNNSRDKIKNNGNQFSETEKAPLPPLHLHLSEDGTSPIPPGWARAPNNSNDCDQYPYYYYHVKSRISRWDPPVYPWDSDKKTIDSINPELNKPLTYEEEQELCNQPFKTPPISPEPSSDDEAPYDWNRSHRYQVTHAEIEKMYDRIRSSILEKQCLEMIHEMTDQSCTPKGPSEQTLAIEIYILVHNCLRKFRDIRCIVGRITNDEDLHYLTQKLAKLIIMKEIQKLHESPTISFSNIFTESILKGPVYDAIVARATSFVKKYMESKGSIYKRMMNNHNIKPTKRPE